jgi:hypothetical protein
MSTYTPTSVFPPSYVIPDDGDPKTASSVNIALEAIGDRTQYLFFHGGREVINYAGIKAILAPQNDDRVFCVFGGDWVFKTAATGPDDYFTVTPGDGTPGAWIAAAYTGILGFTNGIPYMAGGKILDAFIRNAPIYEDVVSQVPASDFTTSSATHVDVTGCSLTFSATAGDLIFVETHVRMSLDIGASAGASVTWSSTIVDPSAGAVVKEIPWVKQVLPDDAMRSYKSKYVAVGTGSYVVKGQIKVGGTATGRVFQGDVSLSVRVVRQ